MEIIVAVALAGMVATGGVELSTRIAQSLANVEDMAIINSKIFMLGEEMEILSKQAQFIGVMPSFYANDIRSQKEDPTGLDLCVAPYSTGDMVIFLFYDEVQNVTPIAGGLPGLSGIYLRRMVCYYRGNNGFLKKYDSNKHNPVPLASQGDPFFQLIPAQGDDGSHDDMTQLDTPNPLFTALPRDGFLVQTFLKQALKSNPNGSKRFEFRFASMTQES